MPRQEPVVARFLGWRDKGSLGDCPQTSVSSVSTDDGTGNEAARQPLRHAIWSDYAALERTDGFDFGSWWEDYAPQHQPQPAKLNKAEVVRPKVATVPAPVPSTTATATCPAALLEALEAMQRGDASAAVLQKDTPRSPVSPGRQGRSPWIGPRKPRAPALVAQLAELELETAPMKDVPPSTTPLPAATEVEEEEALMAFADLSGSEILKICRGHVPSVQKELERQSVERAWQRTRVYKEEAKRGRKRAAHFRRRIEKEMAQSEDDEPTDKARSVFERLERREPIKTVSTRRISLSIIRSDESFQAQDPERRFSLEEDLLHQEDQHELSERSRKLRKKIRDATLAGIREKKKHVDRMHKKRKYREACWKALPHAERVAIERVFKLHCNESHCLTLPATLDALRDIGLRGRTMAERSSVEKAVGTLVRDLIRIEEEGMLGAWGAAPEGEPQIWWKSPKEISAIPAAQLASSKLPRARVETGKLPVRSSYSLAPRSSGSSMPLMRYQPSGPSSQRSSKSNENESTAAKELRKALEKASPRPTGIPLEAFGAEVMPCARWELFEQRTEPHFRLFVQEMETSRNPSGISYDQFQHMISEMGLDKAKGALPPAVKGSPLKIGPDTCLDLEMVHIRLLQLEERGAREAAAREWAIAKLAKVNEQQFRQYRHELLWIYDMFNSHDEEHCGFLGEFEVRRLMKYMGLEPYFRHSAPEIEKLITQVDENCDDEIELTEFLTLVGHVRKLMMKWRRNRVHRCFMKSELDPNECLAYDQIVAALAQDGLLRTRGEYAIAHKLLDEEFDLSSVLRSAARSDDSPSGPGPPPSPRSRTGQSPRRKQRALLMDDPGSVDHHGFSIVYQRVWERLAAIKGERVEQAAKVLNFSMLELSDMQAAFDHFDSDQDGYLVAGEIIEALQPLLPRLPDEQQLRKALPALENPSDHDDEAVAVIDIFEFMKLLKTLTPGTTLVHINKPFSLANDVPFEKQQELLQVWPISESYIQSLDASELIEMLSNFLGVKPEQNLRELAYPVSSFRKLREFALRQAERAQQHTRF